MYTYRVCRDHRRHSGRTRYPDGRLPRSSRNRHRPPRWDIVREQGPSDGFPILPTADDLDCHRNLGTVDDLGCDDAAWCPSPASRGQELEVGRDESLEVAHVHLTEPVQGDWCPWARVHVADLRA